VLLLKLLLVPGLVAAVTVAVRRWGPAVGGWLAGLPVVAGPVLVFYALEQGTRFAASAANGTLTGLIATVAFVVAYASTSARWSWPACVVFGWTTFAAVVLTLHAAQLGSISSLAAVCAAIFIGRRALPRLAPVSARTPVRHSRSDLPVRLVATATMVVSLTGLADQLGPNLSGLLNAFPVLTTIIAVFTHAQRGRAAMVDFLNGYLQSVVGFALFCVVMATTLPWLGLNRALIAALMVQFASHAFLLWRVTRAGSSAGT
jgi:hypothetical protein